MQLTKARVQRYRNIADSSWVELSGNLTCIVGKNQSGKTSFLKALHKFNPHNKSETFRMQRDWPRGERKARDGKQVVCECEFKLGPQEAEKLAELGEGSLAPSQVVVSKNYDGEFEVDFLDKQNLFPNKLHPNNVDSLCQKLPTIAEPVGEIFKQAALNSIIEATRLVREGLYSEIPSLISLHQSALNEKRSANNPQPQHDNENTFVSAYAKTLKDIVAEIENLPTMQKVAHEFVVKRLPTFIYMDDYREFGGNAILDQLHQRQNQKSLSEEDQTILMLLALSGLDLQHLVDQGKSSDQEVIRERQYDLDDAAKSLTKSVASRWGQNPYRIEFRCDGQKFFLEIEQKENDAGMIPLEDQSKGFRWFFSFDLRFMHDSGGSFKNCVLLLDEPGLHLHPGAQADLVDRLDAYGEENVLIYTTHLPFLVDLRDPSRIFVIQEKDGRATVGKDLGASGPDEKLTLQAALGMKLNQHFMVSQKNLVVEGVDDFWVLAELSRLMKRSGDEGLDEDIEIMAAGGASEAVYLATFM